MPIWLRRFNIKKVNEFIEKQNKEMEKSQKGSSPNSNDVSRPNIPDKSSFHFKS